MGFPAQEPYLQKPRVTEFRNGVPDLWGRGDAFFSPTVRCVIWMQGPRGETSSRGLVCGAPVPKVLLYLEVGELFGTGRGDLACTIIKLTQAAALLLRTQPLGGLGLCIWASEPLSGL